VTAYGKPGSRFERSDGCSFVGMWVADLATTVEYSQRGLSVVLSVSHCQFQY